MHSQHAGNWKTILKLSGIFPCLPGTSLHVTHFTRLSWQKLWWTSTDETWKHYVILAHITWADYTTYSSQNGLTNQKPTFAIGPLPRQHIRMLLISLFIVILPRQPILQFFPERGPWYVLHIGIRLPTTPMRKTISPPSPSPQGGPQGGIYLDRVSSHLYWYIIHGLCNLWSSESVCTHPLIVILARVLMVCLKQVC